MNFRSVDLNLLTVFDAILVEGNMTRAAKKIGMSQPAMSLALSRLRHVMDDQLFEREGRGLKPTARAVELAKPVRQALDILANALEPSSDFDCTNSDRVFNLTLTDYGEIVAIPRLMQWLQSQSAKIKIQLRTKTQLDYQKELHFGDLDLFAWITPIDSPEIHYEKVGQVTHSCLVRKDHPLTEATITLENYTEYQHIALEWASKELTQIEQKIRAEGLQRDIGLQVCTYLDVPRVLAATDMISTLPTAIAKQFADEFDLKVLPFPLGDVPMPLYLMWHRSMENDSAHIWLRTFIINLLKRI